jgi:hypothetical protein
MGYKTMAFASGFLWAEWRDADVFIAPPYGPVTEFEVHLLQSTYARILDDLGIVDLDEFSAERYRTRTRLVLSSFDDLVDMPGPRFVFIHLVIPHAPYAFDENGHPAAPDKLVSKYGYLDQVKFINKALLPHLETIINRSKTPPVIIVQGDHGPPWEDDHTAQLKILNAYYLPQGKEKLYPTISPVNSFRVVFNSYFDTDFPLLEDISYYSDRNQLYKFSAMFGSCP